MTETAEPRSAPEPRSRIRALFLNTLLVAVSLVIGLLLLEVLLRVYNPFQTRIKGNRVVLVTNKQYRIRNTLVPSLDPVITVIRNSLGFRGPDPPKDFDRHLTIFAVGGSTTQCFFLSDGQTWPALAGERLSGAFRDVWVNNAGLDGHSTFGHLALMQDHVIRWHPKIVLLLVGANDVAREADNEFDAENVKGGLSFRSPTAFLKSVSAYSEVVSLAVNLYRSFTAYQRGLMHQYVDIRKLGYTEVSAEAERAYVAIYTGAYVAGYEQRLRRVVGLARRNGIEPVLITQPFLLGAGTDDVTGLDLARLQAAPGRNGRMTWELLETYNDATRRVARGEAVTLVDLAARLPKSSRYFYDFIHFNKEGAEAVAGIISDAVSPVLRERFPAYLREQRIGSVRARGNSVDCLGR